MSAPSGPSLQLIRFGMLKANGPSVKLTSGEEEAQLMADCVVILRMI
jgi:hypothetical protein